MEKLPTQTVILMRHAKSDWVPGHGPDIERPLNLRGVRDAQLMAAWLKSRLQGQTKLLCSPAQRTRETAREIIQALPQATMVIEESLYLASLPELVQVVRSHADECLLVLGHNPGLEELLDCIDPDAQARCVHNKVFPTCAVYAYRIDGVFAQSDGKCSFLFHQRPKTLVDS